MEWREIIVRFQFDPELEDGEELSTQITDGIVEKMDPSCAFDPDGICTRDWFIVEKPLSDELMEGLLDAED